MRALLARIYVFRSLCVCVVRYPTTVSNDAVLSKIYIIITENIFYNIYSMVLFIYRRKKYQEKHVIRTSICHVCGLLYLNIPTLIIVHNSTNV